MKVSVIMPVERIGGTADRAIASVLGQQAPFAFELIIVSAEPVPLEDRQSCLSGQARSPVLHRTVRNVVEPNRNPATRRNRGVSEAAGEYLAFIDDDAFAGPEWLARAVSYLEIHPGVVAIGGPDPAPSDASVPELFSDTVLATPLIGSGIAAHENRPGVFVVEKSTDLALVNLIVRRSAFAGFDESIGYIGEDTALIAELMRRGEVIYHAGVRVEHRRRPMVLPYVVQRWRYRVKTGRMLAQGAYRGDRRIGRFIAAGFLMMAFPPLLLPYILATLILGISATRLPMKYWPLIPAAFAVHHATYFFAILWGFIRAKARV